MTYFRALLETITQHYGSSTKSWSPILVKLLPKLMEYANEDDYDLSEETYRDVDITQNSALIIHDYMSVSWISHMFLDEILKALGTVRFVTVGTQFVQLVVSVLFRIKLKYFGKIPILNCNMFFRHFTRIRGMLDWLSSSLFKQLSTRIFSR